ncbi:glycoside hydrolase family 13 protein [Prochlorococcus marinus]|uniref:glycoside hydrolase family 13 protein n=1 Tax=Prochlorococcus TaxID=1218 RepID=UPI0012DAE055|nr:glycoside hydrolase family 13 protein [Prochlorococcus marinus]
MQWGMHQIDGLTNTPRWVAQAVVYQIFPDRFRCSGRVLVHQHLALRCWGSDPSEQGFQGGDLYGVIEALDHLQALGISCLYLTPVFSSAANHRYHAYDYLQVDPLLGGNAALEALIEAVHRREMRIILDGVFNHCGRGFWAFHHLLENGEASPYRNWFEVRQWPLHPYPRRGQDCGYSCWWNDPALPKFNHAHAPVREYLIAVARYWLEQGIDGWRLDVADEVPAEFWLEFRHMVKAVNPDAWILAEIWGDARSWLQGQHFDGVMNYRMGWSSLCWVAGKRLRRRYRNPAYPLEALSGEAFVELLATTLGWYRPEVNRSQLNLLDSHDVPRALHTLQGDLAALKLALLLLFLQPGAPCIYYGTEAGLQGGPEPGCREAFPWGTQWPADLRDFIQSLSDLRQRCPALADGGLQWQTIGADGLHGWGVNPELSTAQDEKSIKVWINRSRRSWLPIGESSMDPLWLVGALECNGRGLGPQSAVLLR